MPNKAFKSNHFSEARKFFTDPTLTNVAKLAKDEDIDELINCSSNFNPIEEPKKINSRIEIYRNKPWFRLLNVFVKSVDKFKSPVLTDSTFDFESFTVFIQVQNDDMKPSELLAEH